MTVNLFILWIVTQYTRCNDQRLDRTKYSLQLANIVLRSYIATMQGSCQLRYTSLFDFWSSAIYST